MRDLTPRQNRAQQRKKLHGPILGSVAAQVVVKGLPGERAPMEAWKSWFKAGCGITGSTEDMSNEDFEKFVWAVELHAVKVLGVQITEFNIGRNLMDDQQQPDQPKTDRPQNPVLLTDGEIATITFVDFYTNPTPPRTLGGN